MKILFVPTSDYIVFRIVRPYKLKISNSLCIIVDIEGNPLIVIENLKDQIAGDPILNLEQNFHYDI